MSDTLSQPIGLSWYEEDTFLKRQGTTDVGKDYEESMIALKCLELTLDDNIAEFKIASNDDSLGSFDDLIVSIEDNNKQKINQAIQLKHSDKVYLSKSSLEHFEGNFSLGKYYYDNHKLLNDDFTYILHTNLKLQTITQEKLSLQYKTKKKDETFTTISVAICKDEKDASGNTCKFVADSKEKKFFDRFRLKTSQENENAIHKRAEEIFLLGFNTTPECFLKFTKFIKDWSMKKGKKQKLNKKFILLKLAEIVLSSSIKPICDSHQCVGQNEILAKVISGFDVAIFEETNAFLNRIWVKNCSLEEANKFGFQNFTITKPLTEDDLQSEEFAKISWCLGKNPLILESTKNCQETIMKILQLFAKNTMRKKFVLLNCKQTKNFEDLKQGRSLNDLKILDHNLYERVVSEFSCIFHGSTHYLKEILDFHELLEAFNMDSLAAMSMGQLRIGGEKEALPEFYVDRKLERIMIKFEFVNEADSEQIIVVSCDGDEEQVRTRIKKNIGIQTEVLGGRQILKDGIVYLSSDFEKIHHYHSDKTCYFFKYQEENLEWLESRGKITKKIRSFQMESNASEEELVVLRKSPFEINVICADPGLGKSTTLKNFNNNFNAKFWPIYIISREHASISNKTVEEFALNFLKDNPIEKRLFQAFYKRRKIIFLWDALDEVFDNNQKRDIIAFIRKINKLRFRQWITSRVNLKEELEEEFHVFARRIREFDDFQQKRYIRKRLENHFQEKQLSKIFEKILENAEFLETHRILGIPIQLYMLTEVLLQNIEIFNDPLTITNLYEHFIAGKLRIFFEKEEITNPYCMENLEEVFLAKCQLLGAKICLETSTNLDFLNSLERKLLERSQTELDPVGVIIHNVTFLHHSFAEYFCALFLSKNFSRLENFKEFYFDEKTKNIRFMFDLLLAKDSPLHIAVLYKDLEKLKRHEENLLSKDLAGRTVLHLALAWDSQHSKLPDRIERKSITVEDYLNNFRISTFLLSKLADCFTTKDELFELDCFGYSQENFLQIAVLTNDIKVVASAQKHQDSVNSFNKNGDSALMNAAFIGNTEIVEYLIKNRADVETVNRSKESALKLAVAFNYLEISKLLIQQKANVSCRDEDGWTPLMLAAKNDSLETAALLVENHADVEMVNNVGDTALIVAVLNTRLQIVKFLINQKSSVNCVGEKGWTPLMCAAQEDCLEIAKCLIDNKADVNVAKHDGDVALHLAVRKNNFEFVKILVQNRAEVNCAEEDGWTPLMSAAKRGNMEIVKLLVENGAQVNLRKNDGGMALHTASLNNRIDVVKFLIDNKAEVNATNNFGKTPLIFAVRQKFKEVVEVLINSADPGIISESGDTALHVAIKTNQFEIARQLIGKSSVFNDSGSGWTPLMHAAQEGNLKIAKALIKNLTEVNKNNNLGASALHIAVWNNQSEITRLLVENKAKTFPFGTFGLTPLLIAVVRGNSEIAKCLIKNSSSEVNCPDNFGFTPLIWAARKGFLEIAKYLLENGAMVNAHNRKRETALNFAVEENDFDIVKLLVEHKANVNFAAVGGWTPLWNAAIEGNIDLVRYLVANGAEINGIVDRDGDTILSDAVINEEVVVCKYLIENGAGVNVQARTGDTPLHRAVRARNFEIVKLLVENSADPGIKNRKGQRPGDLRQITEKIADYLGSVRKQN